MRGSVEQHGYVCQALYGTVHIADEFGLIVKRLCVTPSVVPTSP